MATPFPITLPSGSVLGRLALTAGDAESIPLAQLAAAIGIPFLNSPITKRKPADQSLTTQTSLQNDSDLAFAIAANEEWVVTFELSIGSALTTTGIRIGVTTPAGATLELDMFGVADSITQASSNRTTTAGATIVFAPTANSGMLHGFLWVLNGTTPGTIQFQFAQNSSSGTALTLRKGSFMQATRVA